eukprot:scaffold238398_cov31-Prasinocladus_malaysianus.AAC.1
MTIPRTQHSIESSQPSFVCGPGVQPGPRGVWRPGREEGHAADADGRRAQEDQGGHQPAWGHQHRH